MRVIILITVFTERDKEAVCIRDGISIRKDLNQQNTPPRGLVARALASPTVPNEGRPTDGIEARARAAEVQPETGTAETTDHSDAGGAVMVNAENDGNENDEVAATTVAGVEAPLPPTPSRPPNVAWVKTHQEEQYVGKRKWMNILWDTKLTMI